MRSTGAVRALLSPASVALVGASTDQARPGGRPLHNLLRDGWDGRIFPVNRRRDRVQGRRSWPDLRDLPEVPDHVYVLSATDSVLDVVETCGELGVSVVSVLAGGFGESGPEGLALRARLEKVVAETGVRILGPNTIGVVDTRTGFTLTANAAFNESAVAAGTSFVASQSGSLLGSLVSRGRARGIGFAAMVSVGSEIDLSVGEICASTLDDPGIDSYALFLETLSHADEMRAFAQEAARRGKPVTVYKLGRSQAASDLVVTHTGAITGADDVATTFLAECGIARVDTIEGLLEGTLLAPRVSRLPAASRPRVGVLTATGGGAAMIVDQLGIRGVDARAPSTTVLRRLTDAVGYQLSQARIVDLTLRGTDSTVMSAALQILRDSGEYDLVIQALGSSATSSPEVAVRPALDAPRDGVPFAVFVVPEAPQALAALAAARVPAFRTPESCADAVSALLRRRTPRLPPTFRPAAVGERRTLDLPGAHQLLAEFGLPALAGQSVDLGTVGTLELTFPVVLKAHGPSLAHKTEVGAVALDLSDRTGLAAAMAEMSTRLAELEQRGPVEFVVEPMVSAVAEVLLGFIRDPQVGPLVVLAPGGVLAELYPQRALRLAPIDLDVAHEMILELAFIREVLAGYRGRPPGDVNGLAHALVAFSRLAEDPSVVEAEVNPLMVSTEAVHVVDVLVRVADPV